MAVPPLPWVLEVPLNLMTMMLVHECLGLVVLEVLLLALAWVP
jgi:hypothetical protein